MITSHLQYSEPYETDDIVVTEALSVPYDCWICPRCGNTLRKEDVDKYCVNCGYRYYFYNDFKLIWWIKKRIQVEKRIGEPVLRSDEEERLYQQRRKSASTRKPYIFTAEQKARIKERKRQWHLDNKEHIKMVKKEYEKRRRLDKLTNPVVV